MTALKTITANFTEMKENISLEDADADLDVNDVETALKSVGIALRDSTGQIRNLDEVINDLGMSWQNLSRNTQRYLATTIAGSRQQSRLIALLDDYDRTLELEAVAMDSEGQADLQFAKYADTVEYRINQISTKWEEFTQNLLNSQTFKSALDMVISFLDKLNDFDISKMTVLITAGFIPALKSIITTTVSSLKNSANNVRDIGSEIGRKLKEGLLGNDYSVNIQANITQAEVDLETLRKKMAQLKAENVGVNIEGTQEFQNLNRQINQTEENLKLMRAESNQLNASMNVFKTTISSVASFTTTFALALMNGADAETAFKIGLATLIPQIVSMGVELLTAAIKRGILEKETRKETKAVNENSVAEYENAAAKSASAAASKVKTSALKKENRQLRLNTGANTDLIGAQDNLTKITGKLSKVIGKAGIVAAIAAEVVAITAAIVQIISLNNEYKKQISVTEQLSKATEKLEEAQRNYSDALQDTKELRTTTQTLEEAVDTYEKLSKITNRTDAQNEDLNEAINTLISDYPEILSYYDEENGKISINNELYEQKIELLKQERKEQDALTDFYNQQQIQLKRNQAILQNMSDIETQTGLEFNAAEGANDTTYQAMVGAQGYNASKVERETLETFWENVNNEVGEFDVEFDENAAVDAWNYLYDNAEDGLQNLDSEVQLVLNGWKNSIEDIKQINDGFSDYYSNIYQDLVASGNYADEQQAGIAASVIAGQANAVDNIDLSKFNTYQDIIDENTFSFEDTIANIGTFTAMGAAVGSVVGPGGTVAMAIGGAIGGVIASIGQIVTSSISKSSIQKDMTDDLETTLLEIRENDTQYTEEQAQEAAEKYQDLIYDITNDWGSGAEEFEDLLPETKKKLKEIGIETAEQYEEYVEGFTDAELSDNLSQDFMTAEVTKFQQELQEKLETFFESTNGQLYLENVADFINTESGKMNNEQMVDFLEQQRTFLANQLGLDRDSEEINQILVSQGFDSDLVYEGMYSSFSEAAEILGEQAEIYANKVSGDIADATVGMYAKIVDQTDNEALAEKMVQDFDSALRNSGIDEDVQQIFYGIDWSSFDVGTMNLDDFLNDIAETNDLTEQEKQKLLEVASIAENYSQLDTMVDTLAEAKSYIDTMTESMNELQDQADSYISVVADQINSGEVSFDNYLKFKDILSELGLSAQDYFNIDENGRITTDAEKINELYKDQLKAREQQLDTQIAQLDVQISQLENEKTSLELQLAEIDEGKDIIDVRYNEVEATSELVKLRLQYLNLLRKEHGESELTESDFGITYYVRPEDGSDTSTRQLVENQLETTKLSIQQSKEARQALIEERENIDKEGIAQWRAYKIAENGAIEETEDATDKTEELADAQEKLNDALKEYNELLYGSENRASSLDFLYNYSEALDTFNSQIEDAKENLNEASSIDAAIDSWEEYGNAAHNALAQEQARQQVIQQGLDNYADMIENGTASYQNKETGETISINFGDYASYDERTGKYQVDQALLNQARFNDSYKDLIEEQIETYNNYVDEYETSRQNIEKIEKEFQEQIETANSNYAAMEDEIANVLKEKYQEEVDNLQEKYSAMKEADDDYLDALQEAIDKQRELRDRENDYEDLAQQERKLALMRRDTSGTTQTEVMELEDQISETRQDLLDSEVDSIINGMQDIYESQQELRDVEIELKSAIIDNTAYWNQQASSVAATFVTAEDYMAWMAENSTEFAESTITKQEVLMTEYYDTGAAAMQKYAMDSIGTVENYLLVTTQEVQELANNTGESFTTEVTRAFNETTAQVLEDLASAEQALQDAREALADVNAELEKMKEKGSQIDASDYYDDDEEDNTTGNDGSIGPTKPSQVSGSNNGSKGQLPKTDYYGGLLELYNNSEISKEEFLSRLQEIGDIVIQDVKNDNSDGPDNMNYRVVENGVGIYSDNSAILGKLKELGVISGTGHEKRSSDSWNDGPVYRTLRFFGLGGKGYTATSKFAKGGLVDYTGPAWVDGTPSKPEAFLSAEDTQRIAQLTSVLSNIPLLNLTPNTENISSTSYGDTQIEINLNIDSLSSDIDVENMLDRMKQEIVDVATPVGATNILRR